MVFQISKKILGSLKYDDVSAKDFVDFDFDTHDIGEKLLVGDKYNYFDIYNQVMMKWSQYEESSETKIEPSPFLESMKQNMDTEIKTIHSKLSNITREENNEEEYEMYGDSKEFKTKNGKLSVNIAGIEKSFDKVTLSLSGEYSRYLVKPNFNVKIRGKKDLFGRSKFKLRSDLTEPTLLRSKLNSDIHKKLGLTSILANYATLYINDEYMGLYILTDLFKLSWVEFEYGEKDTTSLYKCDRSKLIKDLSDCENENEDIDDTTEWDEFIKILDNANSPSDIEDIFDIDQFLTEMAIDYLTDGWDHFNNGHNYIMYKPKNGKWLYLSHDFDLDLSGSRYHPIYTIEEFMKNNHLIDILIIQDPTRFNKILQDIVTKVFNPATLFPHIDELKSLIKPYIENDRTPDENGNYPGGINQNNMDFYTIEEWEANSEFTTIPSYFQYTFGIKYWILMRYRYICKAYKFECDPTYMDNNYNYVIDKDVEYKDEIYYFASAYKFIEEYGEL